jgi:arylsulfatase A-like enzyme
MAAIGMGMIDSASVNRDPWGLPNGTVSRGDDGTRSRPGLAKVAIWLGVLAWLSELIVVAVRKFVLGDVRVWSEQAMWMGPLVYTLVFGVTGAFLQLLGSRHARGPQAGVFLLATGAATSALLVFPSLHAAASLLLAMGIAARLAWWSRASMRFDRAVHRSFAPIVLVAALAAAAGAAAPALRERILLAQLPAAPAGAPSILFVILDTVRAWNLSLHGYDRPTTPELVRMAQRGVTFELALTTAPWTLPSHYSAFSGLYPNAMAPITEANYEKIVPPFQPMLAEVLADHGYATAGFVANLYYASSEFGLDRGFARYEDLPVSPGQFVLSTAPGRRISNNGRLRNWIGYHDMLNRKPAARIVDDFLSWQSGVRDRPFFAFLNFYDTHEPYLPPQPFEDRFVREAPRTAFFYDTHRVERLVMWGSAAETRAQMDRYDGSIASLDAQLGRLFDVLDRTRRLDNTIIVITSDHGEQFMEHGKLGHLRDLYLSLLHVPLLIIAPGQTPPGLRVSTAVSIADLPATILELARLPRPRRMPGESLAQLWRQGAPVVGRPVLAEANPGDERRSVLDGRYHYIRNPNKPPELYDVVADRLEQSNLAALPAMRTEVRRLDAVLESLLRSTTSSRPVWPAR